VTILEYVYFMKEHWDQRFAEAEFAYGTDAHVSVREQVAAPGRGRILCLAEGQGRNAVYLASLGYDVTVLDYSAVGLGRAAELAAARGVSIHLLEADLSTYSFDSEVWDGIVSIFGHLPAPLRAKVNGQLRGALKPGGWLQLVGYHPKQLDYRTGGPQEPSMLYTVDGLKNELGPGWNYEVAEVVERELDEGPYHRGMSAFVHVFAHKTSN
jgi:SAM-dependent methyltransferase